VEIDELELPLSCISHNIVVKHINQRATNGGKQVCHVREDNVGESGT
jgi:hypothetical protein